MDLVVEPVAWEVVYPVYPLAPIGSIRRDSAGFHAKLESKPLGAYTDRDTAVVAVWKRYLERARMEHELASRTHGSAERH